MLPVHSGPYAIGYTPYALFFGRATKLPAGFPVEVGAACLPRFHFPGLQEGRLSILSHLDDEIRKA